MIVAAMVNLLDAIGNSVLLVVAVGEVIKGVGSTSVGRRPPYLATIMSP